MKARFITEQPVFSWQPLDNGMVDVTICLNGKEVTEENQQMLEKEQYITVTRLYELDKISHQAMVSMGFRRTYGPEPMFFGDSGIKKLVSRYSRIYTGKLL